MHYSMLQLYIRKESKQQVRFAPYLSHMFSLSLQSGNLPADWLNGQELLKPW